MRNIFSVCLSIVTSIAIFVSSSFGEGQLVSKTYMFRFREVSNIAGEFEKNISSKGKIEIDSQYNYLKITDIPSKIDFFNSMAKTLDVPSEQYVVKVKWLSAIPMISTKPWGASEIDILSIDGNQNNKRLLETLNKQVKNTKFKLLRNFEILIFSNTETALNIKSETEGCKLTVLPQIIEGNEIHLILKWIMKENFYRKLESETSLDIELGKIALIKMGGFSRKGEIIIATGEKKPVNEEIEYVMLIMISKNV